MKDTKKKNLIIPILIILIIIAIIGTIVFIVTANKPEKTVEEFFTRLKEGNIEEAKKYIDNYNDLFEEEQEEQENTEEDFADVLNNEENQKLLFTDIQTNIKEVKKEGNTAKIQVELTTKNFKTIMTNYINKIIQLSMSTVVGGENLTQEEINNAIKDYFIEELKNESIDKATTTQEITLNKKEGKWIIEANDNLRTLIYPGLEEAFQEITNQLS